MRSDKTCSLEHLYDYWQNTSRVRVNRYNPLDLQELKFSYIEQVRAALEKLDELYRLLSYTPIERGEISRQRLIVKSQRNTFTSIEDARNDLRIMENFASEIKEAVESVQRQPNSGGPIHDAYMSFHASLDRARERLDELESAMEKQWEFIDRGIEHLDVIMNSKLPCWMGGLISIVRNGGAGAEIGVNINRVVELLMDIYSDGEIRKMLYQREIFNGLMGYKEENLPPTEEEATEDYFKYRLKEHPVSEIIENLTMHYASLCYKCDLFFENGWNATTANTLQNEILAKRGHIVEVLKILNPPLILRDAVTREQFHGLSSTGWQIKLLWNVEPNMWSENHHGQIHRHAFNVRMINRLREIYSFQRHDAMRALVAHGTYESTRGHVMVEWEHPTNPRPNHGERNFRRYPPEFRGAGVLQLTWQSTYIRFADYLRDTRRVINQYEALLLKYIREPSPWALRNSTAPRMQHLEFLNRAFDGTSEHDNHFPDNSTISLLADSGLPEDANVLNSIIFNEDFDVDNIRSEFHSWLLDENTPTQTVANYFTWESAFWFYTRENPRLYGGEQNMPRTLEIILGEPDNGSLARRTRFFEWLEGVFDE